MSFNLKEIFGKKQPEPEEYYDDEDDEYQLETQRQEQEYYYTSPPSTEEASELLAQDELAQLDFEKVAEMAVSPGELKRTLQKEKLPAQPQTTEKGLFAAATTWQQLGIGKSILEDLVLKYMYFLGEVSGKLLSHKMRVPLHTVLDPILMELSNADFINVLRSTGLGGHNKIFQLTEKGYNRARNATAVSSYIGPAPVHIDDYIQAVNQYPPLKIPPFAKFKEYYKDLVYGDDFLESLAIAFSSGQCLFFYGTPGMGKTTAVKRMIKCCPDVINIPFAVFAEGTVIKFFDETYHSPIDQDFSLDKPVEDLGFDARWLPIKRPCILVATEFSATTGTQVQYDVTGSTASFPLTTKANGGVFIMDDFGRQYETPDRILNLWISKLEGALDILTLRTGQQFFIPYKTMTVFTTNLEPESLLDDAFLRRLTYKLKVPDVSLEEYCQIFANEAERRKITWEADMLEHLIHKLYGKKNKRLAGDQPRVILGRVVDICQYRGKKPPYKLTTDLLDQAWKLHFLAD